MIVWHITAAILTLTMIGTAAHVFRSSFNFIPDRFNAAPGRFWTNHAIDDMLSSNYGFWDMVAGTEYDSDGYYEFFSLRNLRIACTWTIACGTAIGLSIPGGWDWFAATANAAPGWLWALFVHRLNNMTFF
ncbi:hypothetical protein [Pararhizobium antarcticum]|uniref:Uncharacterized protein n=1 Tax=Pararhizobium antarcticum TaxID=1798805 RepID=A0A657LW56_9HYPH|nr:hypothetical protein [Pararhizobium antarcticum]OJF89845.1 hypothetical protein AX761_07610 [Rhizobium sp. 58]OJF99794.1 hypothetical protein AX760_12125 [Pararhizobium antarcticum]